MKNLLSTYFYFLSKDHQLVYFSMVVPFGIRLITNVLICITILGLWIRCRDRVLDYDFGL
jgi:hypothetical protein